MQPQQSLVVSDSQTVNSRQLSNVQLIVKILQWNVQGLKGKLHLLEEYVLKNNISIILVQETLMNEGKKAKISGFKHYQENRKEGTRGMSIYISSKLKHSYMGYNINETGCVETQKIEVTVGGLTYVIINMYAHSNKEVRDIGLNEIF